MIELLLIAELNKVYDHSFSNLPKTNVEQVQTKASRYISSQRRSGSGRRGMRG